MPNSQIIRYSNVDWIKHFIVQTTYNLETDKYHYIIQDNLLSGLFNSPKELENSTVSEDILIPIDFGNSQQYNILISPRFFAISSPLFSTRALISPPNLKLDV